MGKLLYGVLPDCEQPKACGYQDCFHDEASVLYFGERGKGKSLQMYECKIRAVSEA